MKAFAAILIVIAVIFTACGGDGESFTDEVGGGGDLKITEQGAYHDAIDDTPAVDPIERDEAYLAVAKALSAPYVTEAIGPLEYTMRFETGDYADFVVTGIFPDPSGEGEKEAYFTISQTASGYWILDDPVIPEFTNVELNRRAVVERAAQEELERQAKIQELSSILEAFDLLKLDVVNAYPIPDTREQYPGTDGVAFNLVVENPTPFKYEVDYRIDWTEMQRDSNHPRCWRDYESTFEKYETGVEEVPPQTTVEILVEETVGYISFCDDVTLENVRSSITKINGSSKERIQEELTGLQTSPK